MRRAKSQLSTHTSKARNLKKQRMAESSPERLLRLAKQRLRSALARARESSAERAERNERNRVRTAELRARRIEQMKRSQRLHEQKREIERQKSRTRSQKKRSKKTSEKMKIYLWGPHEETLADVIVKEEPIEAIRDGVDEERESIETSTISIIISPENLEITEQIYNPATGEVINIKSEQPELDATFDQ